MDDHDHVLIHVLVQAPFKKESIHDYRSVKTFDVSLSSTSIKLTPIPFTRQIWTCPQSERLECVPFMFLCEVVLESDVNDMIVAHSRLS